jgi:hypothetical protein
MTRGRQARAICPVCGKTVAATIPAHEEGSTLVVRWHRTPDGSLCLGSRSTATVVVQEAEDAP